MIVMKKLYIYSQHYLQLVSRKNILQFTDINLKFIMSSEKFKLYAYPI